jgi:hypothetical protein
MASSTPIRDFVARSRRTPQASAVYRSPTKPIFRLICGDSVSDQN